MTITHRIDRVNPYDYVGFGAPSAMWQAWRAYLDLTPWRTVLMGTGSPVALSFILQHRTA